MPAAPPGYHGRYLRVDLSTCTWRDVPGPECVLRRYVGGTGLGTWMLLRETPERVDPLAAEAPLAFVFSPLVGSPLTTSAKFAVLAKSPLTERINDSLSSSHFAISGKATGYDAIVIVGAAQGPTTLVIDHGEVRFEDATHLWGRTIPETEAALRSSLGRSFRSAVIGPAGENGVRFATISHDGRHAGRGGLGAVMGAKRLKAVVVRGDRRTGFAEPARLHRLAKELSRKSFGPATAKYRELGTVANLLTFNRLGTLPTRNFRGGTFEGAEKLAPETLKTLLERTRKSCAACTIGCEHIYRLPNNGLPGVDVRLEYENLFALGPLCGIEDPKTVLRASAFCDEWGLDTISAGATIAFAMECAERELITQPDLRFGNGDALLNTLHKIGTRSGIGELLSLGTRAAAREIGGGSDEFAPHVKGLEIPGYEPRALQTMALGFAVGTRGADHNRSGAYQVDFSEGVDRCEPGIEVVAPAIEVENESTVMDSLILCKFLRGVLDDKLAEMAEMLALITGWDVTGDEWRATAERLVTAKKWYNIKQGWSPAEDTLPRRFLTQSLPDGASAGASLTSERLERLKRAYNLARGWTPEGWIPEERLRELNVLEPSTELAAD